MLADEDQPQRVVARAARVLVQPRARGRRGGQRPAFLDDEEQLPRPRAAVVELAGDAGAAGVLDAPFDVGDEHEHHRRGQPLRQAGQVEQRQRRVVGDGRRLVGDVRERPALAVGLEAQDQRLQRVGVRPGQLTLAGAARRARRAAAFRGAARRSVAQWA